MEKGGDVYRLVTDQLGSVRLVVDVATGNVAQRIDYDAWGVPTLVTGTWDVQPFGFAGGLYDPDTGLYRFGARDYDPEVGRWTTKDPIRFAGGINVYEYALSDPINLIDTTGLDPWSGDAFGESLALLYDMLSISDVQSMSVAGFWGAGAGLTTLMAPTAAAMAAEALGGYLAAQGLTCGAAGGGGVSAVASQFGSRNAGIFENAAKLARDRGFTQGLPSSFTPFERHLMALAKSVGDAVPNGQVWQIGELNGNPIFGAVRNGLGIVDVGGTTMIVHAPQGGVPTILGPLL